MYIRKYLQSYKSSNICLTTLKIAFFCLIFTKLGSYVFLQICSFKFVNLLSKSICQKCPFKRVFPPKMGLRLWKVYVSVPKICIISQLNLFCQTEIVFCRHQVSKYQVSWYGWLDLLIFGRHVGFGNINVSMEFHWNWIIQVNTIFSLKTARQGGTCSVNYPLILN